MWNAAKRFGVGLVGLSLVVWAGIVHGAVGDAKLQLSGIAGTAGTTVLMPLTYQKATAKEGGAYFAVIDKPATWSLNQAHASLQQACPTINANCANVPASVKKFISGTTGIDANRIALVEESAVDNKLLVLVMDIRNPAVALANPTTLNMPLTVAAGATGMLPVNFVVADTKVRDTTEPKGVASNIAVELTNGSITISGPTCARGDIDCLGGGNPVNASDLAIMRNIILGVETDQARIGRADLVAPLGVVNASDLAVLRNIILCGLDAC